MAWPNILDVVKIKLFPPNYDAWIAKSHTYKERLVSSGSAFAGQWRPLDHLSFADYSGDIINASHRHLADAPLGHQGVEFLIELGITGYLRRGDALKLYELAFRAPGDVLEAGTNKGLSTSILAQAVHDRGHGSIETIELDRGNSVEAERNLAGRPGSERVTFTVSDATRRMNELAVQGKTYGFIFIDHWHGYRATVDAAELAKELLVDGGFVMFHDFLDPGNADRRHVYGVYQAVLDVIVDDDRFSFAGVSGCCAIFQFDSVQAAR
ncbi:class I SAM-dependent methyltransferase [Bradyrhizobium sp. CIAT3101]|uniref:O-methyltransferase n=1 Tax=Bradyrhizobium sp. CIAT3101 TaxID=439387 RepID=UPI0024B12FA7|nr:class I SAM-dependent methyltransferase [Bradyrhizobium sp. CIAT3101]WFU83904.1 class I SAM-dependent methyltransferase [Bradyrhizobium sp. CIAT3101]